MNNVPVSSLAILLLFFLLPGCSTFSERYYFKKLSKDDSGPKYYRVNISGYSLFSDSKYSAGLFDQKAVDLLFGESLISDRSKLFDTSLSIREFDFKALEALQRELLKLEKLRNSQSAYRDEAVKDVDERATTLANHLSQCKDGEDNTETIQKIRETNLSFYWFVKNLKPYAITDDLSTKAAELNTLLNEDTFTCEQNHQKTALDSVKTLNAGITETLNGSLAKTKAELTAVKEQFSALRKRIIDKGEVLYSLDGEPHNIVDKKFVLFLTANNEALTDALLTIVKNETIPDYIVAIANGDLSEELLELQYAQFDTTSELNQLLEELNRQLAEIDKIDVTKKEGEMDMTVKGATATLSAKILALVNLSLSREGAPYFSDIQSATIWLRQNSSNLLLLDQ